MKRILLSLMMIIVVGISSYSATFAYFASSVVSQGNSFTTGDLRLKVNGDSVSTSAVFNEQNLAPGQTIPQRTFLVENVGSLDADHLDLEVTLSGDTDMAKYIVFSGNTNGLRFGSSQAGTSSVRFDVPGWTAGDAEYKVRNGLTGQQITGPSAQTSDDPELVTGSGKGMDRDDDGKVTLADLAAGKIRIAPRNINAGIASHTSATLWMNAIVDSAMDDTFQGKSVIATFTWTLHQNASQY